MFLLTLVVGRHQEVSQINIQTWVLPACSACSRPGPPEKSPVRSREEASRTESINQISIMNYYDNGVSNLIPDLVSSCKFSAPFGGLPEPSKLTVN